MKKQAHGNPMSLFEMQVNRSLGLSATLFKSRILDQNTAPRRFRDRRRFRRKRLIRKLNPSSFWTKMGTQVSK